MPTMSAKAPDDRRQSHNFSISPREWAEIEAAALAKARRLGVEMVSVSEFIRSAVLPAARREVAGAEIPGRASAVPGAEIPGRA